MWKEMIQNQTKECTFAAPAALAEIAAVEDSLGHSLPTVLKELLLESDGIVGEYGLGLVWPLSRILRDNPAFRKDSTFKEIYMPFDNLLFFADAGKSVIERVIA